MHSISVLLLLVVLMNCLNEMEAVTCAQQNNCQNGAACVDNALNTHTCVCTPQWTGPLCDYPAGTTANACQTNPCFNGGVCTSLANGGFSCTCPPNFTGFLCDQTIAVTATTPVIQTSYCLNGGVCVYIAPYYQCICPIQYTGARCEIFTG